MDLNLPVLNLSISEQTHLLEECIHYGYRAIAWNYEWEKGQKLHHADHIHIPSCTNDSKMIKQWKRITLTISDMESLRVLHDKGVQSYDIIAIRPSTERIFHHLCNNGNMDILVLPIDSSYTYKRSLIADAIRRNIVWEIAYAPALEDRTVRRQWLSFGSKLVKHISSLNLIFSSGANHYGQLRSCYDVYHLVTCLGVSYNTASKHNCLFHRFA